MNKWTIIGVVALFVLLVFAFVNPFPNQREELPAYPKTVDQPGEYWIDDSRSILLKLDDRGLLYSEVTHNPPEKKAGGAVVVSHSYESEGDRMPEGTAFGLEAPDTIVIELNNGKVVRRKFGDPHALAGGGKVKVSKKPKGPSTSVRDVIRSIPVDEVEVLSPEE